MARHCGPCVTLCAWSRCVHLLPCSHLCVQVATLVLSVLISGRVTSLARVSVNRPASPVRTAIIIPTADYTALSSKILMSSCFVLVSPNKEPVAPECLDATSRIPCLVVASLVCSDDCFWSLHRPSSPHLSVSICPRVICFSGRRRLPSSRWPWLSAAAFHSLGIQKTRSVLKGTHSRCMTKAPRFPWFSAVPSCFACHSCRP